MSSPGSIKVVLIGESQVGKTCIIARFLQGKFVSKTKPSLTAQYAKKVITLPDKKLLLLSFGIQQEKRSLGQWLEYFYKRQKQ